MKKILLDMQSVLYAKAIRRIIVQELDDCSVLISEGPESALNQAALIVPDIVLMEINGFSPWTADERIELRNKLKKISPECKFILIVGDVAEKTIVDKTIKAKQDGINDSFLFTSTTENYLVAVIDSL